MSRAEIPPRRPPVWLSGDVGNEVLAIDDISYVSFQPKPWLLAEDTSETAIVVSDSSTSIGYAYYILNGDWRLAYQEIVHEGLEACMNLYRAKRERFGHGCSTDLPEER